MKLPIEDEYFRQIKKGEKSIDYRAAHINFIKLNKDTLFGDDKYVIAFELEDEKK